MSHVFCIISQRQSANHHLQPLTVRHAPLSSDNHAYQ